ncbi:fructose-2,6-bisphosphatase [Desulfocapsa sulfexigens DSM 10523]|uniref:Fructose-2,6-bisphosphatase n=1 Tax=Desulfocapsa sulfexigens (strain DSM 10523 / SB164P1) TaxID=1167006 RepID=M1P7Q5_DESSD|nr:histidine phosphatase family protein [Desulfocapsa sulfexigens]AGF79488.1 fructose-2,6-bisphosphatase [Desulfocapsa sulfexigens DSM 10523]
MKKQLILIRHGMTGISGKYVGSSDVPLSADGCRQIMELRTKIPDIAVSAIIASPMLRCRQSCDLLFPEHPVIYKKDLREVDFGRWEKRSFSEIAAMDPGYVEQWAEASDSFCFPGGECLKHFVQRVQDVGDYIASLSEDTVIVVAHGGVIRTLLCYFLKIDPSHYILFKIAKGTYTTLELFPEGAVLTGLNRGVDKDRWLN